MTDRPDLDQILVAITGLNAAAVTLTEYARDLSRDPAATVTTFEDLHETIADALATALDALHPDQLTDDHTQLRGALARFLEGWAP